MRNRTLFVYLTVVTMFWPALNQLDAQTHGASSQDVIEVWKHMWEAQNASSELTRMGRPEPVELSSERMRLTEELSTMLRNLTNGQRDDVARAVIDILSKKTSENYRLVLQSAALLIRLNRGARYGLEGLGDDVLRRAGQAIASIASSKEESYLARRWAIMYLPQLDPDTVGVAALVEVAREQVRTINYSLPSDAIGALGGYDNTEAADALLAMWNDPSMRSMYKEKILTSLSGKSDTRAYAVVSAWLGGADLRRNGAEVSVLLGQGLLARRLDSLETPTADERRRLEDIRSRFVSILRRGDEVHLEVLEQASERLAWITPPDDLERIELLNQIMLKLPESGSDSIRWGLMKAAKRHAKKQPSDP